MSRAFLFPGQGSQSVGMGLDLAQNFPAARQVFAEVDEALHQNLSRLIWEGPDDDLTLTENAQPALMAVSMAVLRVIESESGKSLSDLVSYVAGHSLGEYSALAAAGAIPLADTARLLKVRGQAMQHACGVGDGAMAALFPVELDVARAIAADAAEGKICEIANDNGGGQIVISGDTLAIERATALATGRGVKRAVQLPVSAPFHCSLLASAADRMAEALANIEIAAPVVPLIANVTAAPVEDPAKIRTLLVEQVTATVRWRESVEAMIALGADDFLELGAGKVLAGLVKRISKDVAVGSIGAPADIDPLLAALASGSTAHV
jgi:[acyl-carrier-protein] S-malonyltransferase